MSIQNGNGNAATTPPNGGGIRDPEFQSLVTNLIMHRAELMRQSLEPGRDLDKDCNYPEEPTPADYQKLYDRLGPATRVVQVYPRECWQVQPTVYEDEDPDVVTTFEEAWDELGQGLRSDRSFYQDEAGSPVWEYLLRADELSGVGQYGAILLGLNDGLPLNEPAQFVGPAATILRDSKGEPTQNYRRKLLGSKKPRARRKGIKPPPAPHKTRLTFNQPTGQGRRLTFIRIFPETAATISKFDEDLSSPRFGQPTEYSLTFASPVEVEGRSVTSSTVHWTRIIHVADNLAANEIYGVPRQRPVYNNLLDLRKLYGGSAEMYWRGAFPGYALESLPQFGTEVDYDEEKINSMMFKWSAGLQRHLLLTGLSMKGLSPQVVDPRSQIEVHIEAICIQLGIPVRVFKGTERGELASSQDDAAWNDRLRQRQSGYVTPRLIVPFVDRLIALGVLPVPAGYSVWWPDLTSQSDEEQSTIAAARTGSVVQYADSAGARGVIAPHDYWTRIQGYSEEEAASIVDAAEKERKRLEAEKKKADEEALAKQKDLLDQQRQADEAKARANGTPPPGGPPQAGGNGNTPPGGNPPPRPPTGNQDGTTGNAFCATGPGGGIDPTCSPKGGRKGAPHGGRAAPSLKEFKEKGATKEEIAEFNKLNKERSELNKKVKAGTATDEERVTRDVVLGRLEDLRMTIRTRHEGTTTGRSGDAGNVDKATILDKKTTKKVDSQKVEEPKKDLDYAEALRQKDKAAAEEAKKPFQQGEEATLDRMKNRLHRRPIDRSISDEMHAMMKEMERDSPDRSAQGMTTSEKMKLFKVDGLEVKYPEGARDAAAQTIVDVVLGEKLPKKLWNANDEILFSTQRNKDDAYWEKQFKESGFKSAATGGDGSVVVYNAEAISRGTFAHESGHNLAYREWGSPYPDATSRYSKAQSVEKPVTTYGSKSHAEDFAEATRLYVDKWERDAFKRKFPLKHAALHEIITGEKNPPP